MRAIVLHEHGSISNLKLEENWPEPSIGNDEVLVSVQACSLNYHDLLTIKGMPGIRIPFPVVIGIDVAGEIADIGSNVKNWSIGDRVLVDPVNSVRGVMIGEMADGGLAERVSVNASQLIRIPERVSFEQAAVLPVAYGTAHRMLRSRGNVTPGESILILGASGGVGTSALQLAKLFGADVAVAASSQEKLTRLVELGADWTINYKEDDLLKATHEIFGKPRIFGSGGVDVVVNFTAGETWGSSLKSIRKGGRLLNCGATAGYDVKTDLRYVWTFELTIIGSNGWLREDLTDLLELVSVGKLAPEIYEVFKLEDADQALRTIESRSVLGKIVVSP